MGGESWKSPFTPCLIHSLSIVDCCGHQRSRQHPMRRGGSRTQEVDRTKQWDAENICRPYYSRRARASGF